MKGLHFKAEILLIRVKRVNITGNHDFFPPYRKKKPFQNSRLQKSMGQMSVIQQIAKKKKAFVREKKKYKLDFRKGHFGQGT